jgi:RNA polymerase sigma factor (sigma-70 family)
MRSALRGDRVLHLFEQYYFRVVCFARRAGGESMAEDVAQEVFARLMRKPGLEEQDITPSYLIKIADNIIKRSRQRSRSFSSAIEGRSARFGRHGTDDDAPLPEDEHSMEDRMSRLDPNECEAVHMIVCRGMSYEAAANALNVRVSTVNNWKFRGIRRLKSLTDDDECAA